MKFFASSFLSQWLPTFVVTGGPCSGKTTAINSLPDSIAEFQVVKVPEAATLYFERGGRFPSTTARTDEWRTSEIDGASTPCDVDRAMLWEGWLLELKISLENNANAAAASNEGGAVVVCDRGALDSRAYLSSGTRWTGLLNLMGLEERELLERYEGVVCLDVAPEDFYNRGNLARHETYAEACDRHTLTVDAWEGALRNVAGLSSYTRTIGPNFRRIANPGHGGFEGKVAAVEQYLLDAVASRPDEAIRKKSSHRSTWAMPIDFVIEQADLIASTADLKKIAPRSIGLLRDIQLARANGNLHTNKHRPLVESSYRIQSPMSR